MKKAFQLSQLDQLTLYKGVRKAIAPPSHPHKGKKYNRTEEKRRWRAEA
jgi:hypothetical protein